MTCIVGLVYNNDVYMGADSAGVSNLNLALMTQPKVFRNKDFLIGYTTSFRMGQLLQYSFIPPTTRPKTNIYKYMVGDFVDAVRCCFKGGGFASKDKEVESAGTFLVGYHGRLFRIEDDYQVLERLNGYDAIGCGTDFALGSLLTTEIASSQYGTQMQINPNRRIYQALLSASTFSAAVSKPFHIKRLQWKEQGK